MMKCKVYLSDEGFGHIVRQRAIIEEIRRLDPSVRFTVQTHRHLEAVRHLIKDIEVIDKYNNITWNKRENGSPDIAGIKDQYADYLTRSDRFLEEELEEFDYDFLISDLVYEAFEVGHRKSTPSFGVAHFTWDWFFSKLYPPPLTSDVFNRFLDYAGKASVLYFAPFTPPEILIHYKNKVVEVPLILRSHINHKTLEDNGKFKVLIMDSGAGILRPSIQNALDDIQTLDDFQFFISLGGPCDLPNVSVIGKNELLVDYIADMDLVIGRAGFNTISECIGLRTPMLLLSEAMNPEMNENIISLKHSGLGSFMSLGDFESRLSTFLPQFVKNEYRVLETNMKNHDMRTDGAAIIAEDILNRAGLQ